MSQVTVLMSTYKEDLDVLQEAIDSILDQTFEDFTFLIIVDKPDNEEIIDLLSRLQEKDKRIKFFINKENLGLPLSLNRGIDLAESEYIARMDADDYSLPDRLEKQVKYMKENPDISLIGTNATYMDEGGKILFKRGPLPTRPKEIKEIMKYMNVFYHPSFFGKAEVFKKYKYRNLKYSQDYDFTCRLLENGENLSNLPDHLLNYRLIPNSDKKTAQQKMTMYCIQDEYRKKSLTEADMEKILALKFEEMDYLQMTREIKEYDSCMATIRAGKKLAGYRDLKSLAKNSTYIYREVENLKKYALLKLKYHF